jgi:oxaloacetate decarboxylase (Na+ extruding) subunit gamma
MTELMSSGVELMLMGMGIVYAFLAMLIVAISVMAELIARFFPAEPVVEIQVQPVVDRGTIAAISAAVHKYRAKYK